MKKAGLVIFGCMLVLILVIGILLGSRSHSFARAAAPKTPANSVTTATASSTSDPDGDANGPAVIRFAEKPEAMPAFEARDLDGNMVSTASLAGKVVLLNFWATWCPPCREEIPGMIDLQSRYKGRVQIIGVSMDDSSPEDVKKFVIQEGMNYPVVMWNEKLIEAYGGVPALPTTFVVSPEGRVVQKHVGLISMDNYDLEIRALLKMPVQAKIETFADVGQIFAKNAANATELPDVDMSSLTPAQKKIALKRMNSETCTCGCKYTIAQCRINDTDCPVSKGLAAKIVKEVGSGTSPQPANSKTVQN